MLSAKELEVRLWYRNRRKKTDQVHNNHVKHESGSKCCDSTHVGHARLLGPTSSSNGSSAPLACCRFARRYRLSPDDATARLCPVYGYSRAAREGRLVAGLCRSPTSAIRHPKSYVGFQHS